MFSDHRITLSGSRALAILTLTSLLVAGGCATPTSPEAETSVRQAAIQRWTDCIERRSAAAPMNTNAQASVSAGCEGHRRDVVLAFPPHMKRRLENMLDDREARLTRTNLVKRVRTTSGSNVINELAESLSDN